LTFRVGDYPIRNLVMITRCMETTRIIAIAALLAGCASSAYYVNERTGERIPAMGPSQNADLAACQAEYQRAFAQTGGQLWFGEIVPDCMKARGWRRE